MLVLFPDVKLEKDRLLLPVHRTSMAPTGCPCCSSSGQCTSPSSVPSSGSSRRPLPVALAVPPGEPSRWHFLAIQLPVYPSLPCQRPDPVPVRRCHTGHSVRWQ